MESRVFERMDPIMITRFLHQLKIECDNKGVKENGALWRFAYFMMMPAASDFTGLYFLQAIYLRKSVKNEVQTRYCQLEKNNLCETQAA